MVITNSTKNPISINKTPNSRNNCTSTINEIAEEENNYESEEAGCEIALCQGHICNIPYDLYDLPDLKEIFSLETWNCYLTENERLTLAAYLPDMDMHEFYNTIKELFSGDSIFFGNPIEKLFRDLKGGLYSPEVTQTREFILFLQRRAYYHSLKLYQDCMIEKFADMALTWSNCEMKVSVQEKIQILNKKLYEKEKKPRVLVDLNEFPAEEEVSVSYTHPFIKKFSDTRDLVSSTNEKEKEFNLFQKELVFKMPKGVLKLKPKINNNNNISFHALPGKTTVDCLQSGPSRNFISRAGPSWGPHDSAELSPYIYRNLRQVPECSSIENNRRERTEEPYEKNLLQNFGLPENSARENNFNLDENQNLFLEKLSDRRFPITYKRRKAQRKLDLMDPNNLGEMEGKPININYKGEEINLLDRNID